MFFNVCKQIFHISHVRISQKSKRCSNVKSSTYYFHMKTKILADFQIYYTVPLTFDCLCFPKFFPYYRNLLSSYFGNRMDSQEKSLHIHEWERCGYSFLFSMN